MENVDLLNALLCLCQPDAVAGLYQLGFKAKDARLEYPAGISGEQGVVVDLLLTSTSINSFLCIEGKAGQNIEATQGRAYRKLKTSQFAPLVSKWHTLSAFSVDVAYICTAAHLERIRKGLIRENLDHALLCFYHADDATYNDALAWHPHWRAMLTQAAQPCLITLERSKLKNARLASHLAHGFALDLARVPSFCRFDLSSSPARTFRCLLDAIAEFAAQEHVTTEQLTEVAYGQAAWAVTVRHSELLHRAAACLTTIATHPTLSQFIQRDPADFSRNPARMIWQLQIDTGFSAAAAAYIAGLSSTQSAI